MFVLRKVRNNYYKKSISSTKNVGTKSRVALIPQLDETFRKRLEDGTSNPKYHSGTNRIGLPSLPDELVEAIKIVLKDVPVTGVKKDAENLYNYLKGRQPPISRHEFNRKTSSIIEEVQNKIQVDSFPLSEKAHNVMEEKATRKVDHLLRSRVYAWKPINYTTYVGKQYLVGRMAAEYAVLTKLFSEIMIRCPDFKPHSLYDFGSGVGTVLWAARKYWENSIQEYFCVDSSAEMNDISRLLLQNGNENASPTLSNLFYRQFLASISKTKYSIVVCSYTLFELPSSEIRLETLLKLWNRTEDFLVIVDFGTAQGFKLIHEARNFILEIEKISEYKVGAHIFAPCPHDLDCPLVKMSEKPCCFPVPYLIPPLGRNSIIMKEYFSYVIIRKGKRPEDDPQWPRAVRATLKKKKHTICYLCTKEGKYCQIVCTQFKNGKTFYECTKFLKSGDRFPVDIKECVDDFEEPSAEIEEITEDNS